MVYQINNAEYLLVEVPVEGADTAEKLRAIVKVMGCIMQGFDVTEIPSFWALGRVKAKILVPTSKIFDFQEAF